MDLGPENLLSSPKQKQIHEGGQKKYKCTAPTSLAPLIIKVGRSSENLLFACLSHLLRRISVAKIVGVEYINERKRVLIPLLRKHSEQENTAIVLGSYYHCNCIIHKAA